MGFVTYSAMNRLVNLMEEIVALRLSQQLIYALKVAFQIFEVMACVIPCAT